MRLRTRHGRMFFAAKRLDRGTPLRARQGPGTSLACARTLTECGPSSNAAMLAASDGGTDSFREGSRPRAGDCGRRLRGADSACHAGVRSRRAYERGAPDRRARRHADGDRRRLFDQPARWLRRRRRRRQLHRPGQPGLHPRAPGGDESACRHNFDWTSIERSPGKYDFSVDDWWVAATARKHIRILPVLFGSPSSTSTATRGACPHRRAGRRSRTTARLL